MDDEYCLEVGFIIYAPPFVLPDAPEDDSIWVRPEIEINYVSHIECHKNAKFVDFHYIDLLILWTILSSRNFFVGQF